MMKRQYDYLIKEIDLIDNAINELEKKVFVVNGNFEADDRNGQTYCYLRTGIGKKRHRRYLGTKTAEIAKLYKTNEIKNRLLTSLKEDKGALEMCVDSLSAFSSDELVSQLPKAFKKIKVNDFGDERLKDIFKWAAAPHQKNDKSFPDAKIYAADGQRVRSKGECLWYNLLLEAGIPFVYDVVLELKNEDGLIVRRAPDFIIQCYDGSFLIIEHAGLLSDIKYAESFSKKLKLYLMNGFVLWDNFFITSDDQYGGTDTTAIKRMICIVKERFLNEAPAEIRLLFE